jgi:signal transduction histidine kinase
MVGRRMALVCGLLVLADVLSDRHYHGVGRRRGRSRDRSAQYASTAKTNILANISHKLRTPLNSIIGYSDYMLARKIHSKTRQLTK